MMSSNCSSPAALANSSTSINGHLDDSRFRRCFEEMRRSGEMCDVTLVVEDCSFRAHKLILAGCSPYFRGMFRENSFGESHSERIPIDPKGELGIRADAVEQLISYMYSGRVDISHQNVIDLIRAADLMELAEIKNETLKVIEEHISFDTYLDIRDVGNVFNCPRLLEAVDKFIRRNFSEFTRSQAFLELKEDELMTYLKHNHLRTDTEETVFKAALEWCRSNDKIASFPRLADHIRFDLVSIKSVCQTLKEDTKVRENTEVSNLLLDKMQSLSIPHTVSRPRFSTQVLVAMPYRSKSFYLVTFYGGSHIEFSVREFPDMINEHINALINYSVCRVGHHLYMAGGCGYTGENEQFHSDRGFLYDVVEDKWSLAPSLPSNNDNFGMAAIGNRIYIVGGEGGLDSSDETVVLDLGNNGTPEWVSVARMNYRRTAIHMVVVGQLIYALGGLQDGGYTSTVEVFDPDTEAWIEVDPMTQARCNPGVAVAGGKIYVVGGLGDNLIGPPGALKTVEYYDPEADTWTLLPDMYFARHSPAVSYVNNKLYVFGGGSPSPLLRPGPERTIECFDFERHEWFVQQAKIPGRSNAVYVGAFFDHLDS